MSTIQSLASQVQILQESVLKSFDTIVELQQEIKKLETEQQQSDVTFSTFLVVELSKHFSGRESEIIVAKLKRCREIGDFSYFTSAYRMINDDHQKRQLLKLVSSAYRIKFGKNDQKYKSKLKSEIKFAKSCPECGAFAAALYNRMIQENLI